MARHILRNDDWDFEFLFFEKLDISEISTKQFVNFLNVIIPPDIREIKDGNYQIYFLINPNLEKQRFFKLT